ncbi:MAG: hypothetical protein AB7E32_17525 [Desulfovibrio sp.]
MTGVQSYYFYCVFMVALAPLRFSSQYSDNPLYIFLQALLLMVTLILWYLLAKYYKPTFGVIAGAIMLLNSSVPIPSQVAILLSGAPRSWVHSIWLLSALYFIYCGIFLIRNARRPEKLFPASSK